MFVAARVGILDPLYEVSDTCTVHIFILPRTTIIQENRNTFLFQFSNLSFFLFLCIIEKL